jgi:hypothetical protein
LLNTPRTDPGVPNSGTGLLPWVLDGKSLVRPRVKYARAREPYRSDWHEPLPCHTMLLASAPQRAQPEIFDVIAKGANRTVVGGDCVVRKVPLNHLLEPFPLLWNRFMQTPSECVLDLPEGRPHAIPAGLPLELESTAA